VKQIILKDCMMRFLLAKNNAWALVIVALLDTALVFWGLQILFIPKIYMLARSHNFFLYYEGEILIFLAVALAWFRGWAANRSIWLLQEAHRWISALLMLGVMGIEATMHFLSIPHIEGWWMPIIGSGAFASAITALVQKRKRKPKA
jgi:hypothetical protein